MLSKLRYDGEVQFLPGDLVRPMLPVFATMGGTSITLYSKPDPDHLEADAVLDDWELGLVLQVTDIRAAVAEMRTRVLVLDSKTCKVGWCNASNLYQGNPWAAER